VRPASDARRIIGVHSNDRLDDAAAVSAHQGRSEAGLARKHHILTVVMEDYYHVSPLKRVVARGHWPRFEKRLEIGTRETLSLLDEFGIRATFFVLGWVADAMPELVRAVAERGHEIASKGYFHRNIGEMTPDVFREDLARAREALERAAARPVRGYRVAEGRFTLADLWALDILADEGYAYDSSIRPIFREYASEPWRRFAHEHRYGDKRLWEFPSPAFDLFGFHLPIAGGNYFRQFPHLLVKHAVAQWDRTYAAPFVMYFHTWELDPAQPKLNGVPFLSRVRQYRNLDKMQGIVRHYLARYRFSSVSEYLGLDSGPVTAVQAAARTGTSEPSATNPDQRRPVSVVIPCFNEELIVPYLNNTLQSVERTLRPTYDLQFIFVDDGSSDGTWGALQQTFGSRTSCLTIRHTSNQGVAAAIMTGIRTAEAEIVCSIDCDCTYDPHELSSMIPLLADGVDMVTASPYHPLGSVKNVAQWRLTLSRGASELYRLVLHQKLATYTSCFRVYRRSSVSSLQLKRSGFLGVAEMLGRLDLSGGKVVEYPTQLEARLLGRSKMKVLRTIVGHLGLLASLALERMRSPRAAPAVRKCPDVSSPAM
jgi:polysaccharide deacetylase family protein (PEP-CTERM system associated)